MIIILIAFVLGFISGWCYGEFKGYRSYLESERKRRLENLIDKNGR